MILVCVFDSIAERYTAPMVMTNQAAAIRAFSKAVNHDDAAMKARPSDYSLILLGEWDEVTGIIVPTNPMPTRIILGIAVVERADA